MRRYQTLSKRIWAPVVLAAGGALVAWQLAAMPAMEASPPVDQKIDAQRALPASFADVIEAVQPAVVGVAVTGSREMGPSQQMPPGFPFGDFDEFFRRFFERQQLPGVPERAPSPQFQGFGSGFIVSADGYVVTNQHVVDHADEVKVRLDDGRELSATVVGVDEKTDLAVLKVESDEPLPYARFGDSDETRVGDWVIAIGDPFGFGGSASAGIVSARGRDIQSGPYDDFIQIDAPINRGNSGGPLFDLNGRVVGINTAIFSPNGGNVGIGFAIPANLAVDVVEDLRTTGKVVRGYLGVTIQSMDEEIAESLGLDSEKGALVASVVPGGPAAEAGLEPGDVILSVDGTDIEEVKDVSRMVAELEPEDEAELTVVRNGERMTLDVTIGESPTESETARADAREPAVGLGVTLGELTPSLRERFGISDEVQGAVIVSVAPGSGAAEKGLRPGDVIVSVGQTAVSNLAEAKAEIDRQKETERGSVLLRIVRGGNSSFVAVPVR